MTNIILQSIIFATACVAIWLIQRKEEWSKWGFVIGLIGQPFWIYSCLSEQKQWGMLGVCVWFTFCYAQGIYKRFKK